MTDKAKQPWVDGPYRLIETPGKSYGVNNKSTETAYTMAMSHNSFIRALNAIYLQCRGLDTATHKSEDISDFLTYCQVWTDKLQLHHDIEEEHFFPGLEKLIGQKGLFDTDRHQHEAFRDGFHKFANYVNETNPGRYDGLKLQQIIDSFGNDLETHMHDEIGTLLKIGEKYDPDGTKLNKMWSEIASIFRSKGQMSTDLPFILSTQDQSFEGGIHKWPPVPFFLPYLAWWIGNRGEYAGCWRFAGSDFFGKPRELKFLPA